MIRVQTIADVIDRFRNHPESKSAGSDGNPADRWTFGLLARRPVRTSFALHIGKETNLLEQQEEGVLVADPQAVYFGEDDQEALRELLWRISIPKLAVASGASERMLRAIRSGERRASARGVRAIVEAVGPLPGTS